MINLIHRKNAKNTEGKKCGYGLVAAEEILFWGGLGTLVFGSGWVAILGGIALCVSVILVVFLWVYSSA